jgi:hypothetical protein
MLDLVHGALRNLIYEHGRISPREVAVSFAAPTKDEIQRLTQPTVNFFLATVQENVDLRQTSFQATRVNGRAERKLPPRRVGLQYMVSAIASEPEDEHRMLWRALVTLMQFPELPADVLSEPLRQTGIPLTARAAQPDDAKNALDVWSALGAEPHPAFFYALTVPVDLELTISSPLVLTRTVRFGRGLDGATEETSTHVGGIVRAKDGAPVAGARVARVGSAAEPVFTNAEGEFTLLNVPAGAVEVRVIHPDGTERTTTLTVPSGSYDIVLT